jgi:ATP-dependent Clp protease ATP-binding subunit ClpB
METDFLLSHSLIEVIAIAQQKAREYTQENFSGGHLLYGILQDEESIPSFLQQTSKDLYKLRSWAEFRIAHYPKSTRFVENPFPDSAAKAAFKEADRIRSKNFGPKITPLHLLEALCTPDIAFTTEQLKRFPLSLREFEGAVEKVEVSRTLATGDDESSANKSLARALEKYCNDISVRARQGKIDPVIGRDKELKQLIEILGKRLSPNVLIIGESGVGKTAVVGGLALDILNNKVPSNLKDATIFELDVNGQLVAGAYKGEVEQRLKEVLKAIKEYSGKAILFIDEIHVLLDESSAVGSGAVNLLKPELARGELTVIGATTQVEYRKFIESDEAFKRRFTVLKIEEPTEPLAIEMLKGLVPRFEKHHGLQLAHEAVQEAVTLASRYLRDKNLPVSAIEVIDYAMSAVKVMNDTSGNELEQLENEWKELTKTDDRQSSTQISNEFKNKVESRLSQILISKLTQYQGDGTKFDWTSRLEQLRLWTAQKKETVEKEDITAIVSYLSGIPLGKIQSTEQEKLKNLESAFRKRVIGQDHALSTVSDALRRSRAGINEANKPAAVFFFLGPTGTGKTELAKAIAEGLFSDENALIRFDMSEFKEEHSVALLYGSPPGYIGYKEGGLLVNKIRQKPYSVLLFDEIEKAHQSVYDVFLQILDEGIVHDKLDRKGDFTNAVVIFTSNVGAEKITAKFQKGDIPDEEFLKDVIQSTGKFRPEMLGRTMDIIPFAPITKEVASKILELHLNNFKLLLEKQQIGLELSDEAKQELLQSGFSPTYGARPLKETIRKRLGNSISNKIICGEVRPKDIVRLGWENVTREFKWDIVHVENNFKIAALDA